MFQVEIRSQQLEICKSVCMFIVLAFVVETDQLSFILFRWLPIMAWPREEKISNHGCWGKHAHIPDDDYWGICLFHVVWTNFCFAIILMWYTRNIFFFSSTEQCAWAIISPKEFKSWVTRISFALLPGWQNYLLSNIFWFVLKICFWAHF
jgi:hypothetical protein